MKKFIVLIITFFISIINIYGYENDYFKINIPEYFKEDKIENGIYTWKNINNEHESIVITIVKSKDAPKVQYYTEENIKEYEKYLEKQFESQLKDYSINIEISNTKKEKINDLYTLTYDVYFPSIDLIGYNIYQKGYIFTINNFVYMYTFSTDKEINNNDNLINSINSFEPSKLIKNTEHLEIKLIILIGSLAAVIATIIKYIIKFKKKKHKN